MRTILLTLVIAALTASTALAQQVSPHKSDKPVSSGKLLPVEWRSIAFGARAATYTNACARCFSSTPSTAFTSRYTIAGPRRQP